jgi:RES domain
LAAEPGLAWVRPDRPVYRVGRRPDLWVWPDWAYAAADGTFGNRWDDPLGSYRVLYACSQRVGAFVETLARFRPDLAVVVGLAEIDGAEDAPPVGVVPRSWLTTRLSGEAIISGHFVDVGDARSLATLRVALASRAIHHGLAEIDGAAIRLRAPRAFTQEVSRFVYAWRDADGPFAGICYLSRLDQQASQHARVAGARVHHDGGTRTEPVVHEIRRGGG